MVALRGLLVALLPGGLCVREDKKKSAAGTKKYWPCEQVETNLCVPQCPDKQVIVRGTGMQCPLSWQCCSLSDPEAVKSMREDETYARKRRLAKWQSVRMEMQAKEEEYLAKLLPEGECDWKWYMAGCASVCMDEKDPKNCVVNCRQCKDTTLKKCFEFQMLGGVELPYSYSLSHEVCQIAASEKECDTGRFDTSKISDDQSVGNFCELQCIYVYTDCEGVSYSQRQAGEQPKGALKECEECEKAGSREGVCKPSSDLLSRLPKDPHSLHCERHFCQNVCAAKCNRCNRDTKSRHQCFADNGVCNNLFTGCKHLCRFVGQDTPAEEDIRGQLGSAIDLMNTYTTQLWSFSEWVITTYMLNQYEQKANGNSMLSMAFERDGSTCRIYYDDSGDDQEYVDAVKNIALMREPVNIQMNKWGYSQLRMTESFCDLEWHGSAYDDRVQVAAGKLPPNIAIGCDSPVMTGSHSSARDVNTRLTKGKKRRPLYILTAIWPAFDSANSPDLAYFFADTDDKPRSLVLRDELRQFYEKVLKKVVAAAVENNARSVVLDGFGLDRALEVSGDEQKHMQAEFKKALAHVVELDIVQQNGIWFVLQRHKFNFVSEQSEQDELDANTYGNNIKLTGTIFDFTQPAQLMKDLTGAGAGWNTDKKPTVVFVSSGDVYSFIGSGNTYDASTDGQVGRATALAVLGWPQTNPQIKLVAVTDKGEPGEPYLFGEKHG